MVGEDLAERAPLDERSAPLWQFAEHAAFDPPYSGHAGQLKVDSASAGGAGSVALQTADAVEHRSESIDRPFYPAELESAGLELGQLLGGQTRQRHSEPGRRWWRLGRSTPFW